VSRPEPLSSENSGKEVFKKSIIEPDPIDDSAAGKDSLDTPLA
jgi:hypothetical protein